MAHYELKFDITRYLSEKEFMFYCTVNVTFRHLMATGTQNYYSLSGRANYPLLLKYYTGQCALLPPTWAKSLTKFNP